MRILIIDDEAALRQTIRLMLEEAGHTVTEAEDGRTGLRRLGEEPADVVLSDIIMPEMEGIETIRELRARRDGLKAALAWRDARFPARHI